MNVKKTKFEKIRIVCDMNEKDVAIDYIYDRGYTVISQGPLRKGLSVNMNKFCIVGERQTGESTYEY